jgi:hypothetical protein
MTALLIGNAQRALTELNHPDWVGLAIRPQEDDRSPR